ncbi:interleukin-34 [Astyanax mexicanus]|uniref:Interleukin-34 n=1 Tax=Astyanax mexicanus TaxID=7994 RepID=A0A8B9K841_ASTMX|nr:interleukin-34 [Astyanax mexicanus]
MVQCKAWILRGLLALLWVLPVWTNTMSERCTALHTVKDQLNSTLRRRYLKQNFPINYTIQVPYEEVFRLHNISKLNKTEENVQVEHLQHLWLIVAKAGIKRILRVLPERHPTRKRYLTQLENLFRLYEQRFGTGISEEDDYPDIINDILERIGNQNFERWRSVTPKSLIDNCYRTMHCLFKECFSTEGDNYDYCDLYHWRKRKGTTPQPT